MSTEGGFELVLTSANARQTALGALAGTLTFSVSVADQVEWESLKKAVESRARFYVYGSFEDEVAAVLRTDRDKWKKTAQDQLQRIAYLERMLAEAAPGAG